MILKLYIIHYFHFNIFRHHRGKHICKTSHQNRHLVSYWLRDMMYVHRKAFRNILFSLLCGVMHTTESDSAGWSTFHTKESDSMVWCTPRSLTPKDDAQHRVWLHGGMRRNRKRIKKYFSLFVRGPDGFGSWKNRGQKSCDTHPVIKHAKTLSFCAWFSWIAF